MSKRTERRAAERAAHKANRPSSIAAAAAAAVPTQTVSDPGDEEQSLFLAQLATARERTRQFLIEHPVEPKEPTTSEAPRPAGTHRCHGLIAELKLNADESPDAYLQLVEQVHEEYNPQTPTEARLACSLIQHYWFMQRALRLQAEVLGDDDKKLALYLRYQTTHERSYYKAQKELKAAVKERARLANGFEQQKQKSDLTEARVRLTRAKAQHLEIDTACRQVMDSPIPGHGRIGFEQLTKACSDAIATVLYQNQQAGA